MKRLLPLIVVIFAVSLFAADFWKTKDPNQWSDDEVTKMLSKSPWAKSVTTQTLADLAGRSDTGGGEAGGGGDTGGGSATGGGGGGGRGGGSRGGGGMVNSIPLGPTSPPIFIRWEGAAPVRAARARQQFAHSAEIDKWLQENYVVSLTGFQTRGLGQGTAAGESRSGTRGAQKQGDQRAGGPPADMNPNADLPSLWGVSIKCDGKQAVPVNTIMVIRTAQGAGLYLLFSRKNAIAIGDNEVTIEFTLNRAPNKVKFKLKDMEYQGKLQL
jgi:hypothetical protein